MKAKYSELIGRFTLHNVEKAKLSGDASNWKFNPWYYSNKVTIMWELSRWSSG